MNIKEWKNNWESIENLSPGGQASAKKVLSKNSGSENRFLKILSKQNDFERRKRMYREVAAYRTLDHSGIPKLIDSNTEYYNNSEYKLYLVTEYFDGQNLYEYVKDNGPLSLENSIKLALKLLDIVNYCHAQECLHRDIKPNNIILFKNDIDNPILVDFGLSFNNNDCFDFQTEHGQEIGNRFLRLPELGIDSTNKRDQRSDITFVCGILIYTLTGFQPVNLIDENSRLPHQREHIFRKLLESIEKSKALLNIFDRGFQNNIQYRWDSGEHLYEALSKLTRYEEVRMTKNSNDLLAEIKGMTDSASMRLSSQNRQILSAALKIIGDEFSIIFCQLGKAFTNLQTGYNIDIASLNARNTLGVNRIDGIGEVRFKFNISIIGSDLLISVFDGKREQELLRTDSCKPRFDDEFKENLKIFILSGIHSLL